MINLNSDCSKALMYDEDPAEILNVVKDRVSKHSLKRLKASIISALNNRRKRCSVRLHILEC
jgi:soluble P-type ATPase